VRKTGRSSESIEGIHPTLPTVSIRLPAALAERVGSATVASLEAKDVSGALAALGRAYPEVARLLYTPEGTIRPFVNIFLGDRVVSGDAGATETLEHGDELRIVPSIAGG
jgi:adenylyltransferase/sulfurtransferase